MGIDAARQIVTDDNRSSIQVVIFATTTPVFTE
ncbi:MAG: hypothetical protein JWQ70_3146, partial [Aeromicrobium sp.]|nr:hypothetical protein [Aeromicrobium sp.]